MYSTNWNDIKSWFKQIPYKTKNMSQTLKHDLHVLKPQNPTKPKTWFEVPPKWSQKSPSTKSKTCLVMSLDTQPSPTKKCFVPNVDALDFVGENFGGIQKKWVSLLAKTCASQSETIVFFQCAKNRTGWTTYKSSKGRTAKRTRQCCMHGGSSVEKSRELKADQVTRRNWYQNTSFGFRPPICVHQFGPCWVLN